MDVGFVRDVEAVGGAVFGDSADDFAVEGVSGDDFASWEARAEPGVDACIVSLDGGVMSGFGVP